MKKHFFLLILLSFWAGVAAAAVESSASEEDLWKTFAPVEKNPVRWVISPLAFERRLEAATNPVMESRDPLSLAVGLRKGRHLFSVEYSQFGEQTGNQSFRVERKFQDLLAWYRYAYWKKGMFAATAGGGLGFYQENVTTYFYDLKQDLSSGNKWSAAVGTGLDFSPSSFLVFTAEARLISGQNLDPNPNPDFLVRMSIQF